VLDEYNEDEAEHDMLDEVAEFYSLLHTGVDWVDASVTVNYTDDSVENVKSNLRLPVFDKQEGNARWDAYFKSGLSSLAPEEQEAINLYRDVIIKEGDLAAYELDTTSQGEEGPSPSIDELMTYAQSVLEKLDEHCSVCPYLEGLSSLGRVILPADTVLKIPQSHFVIFYLQRTREKWTRIEDQLS
jgi:hypothetical protein